ncbi:MAG: hypothetical protein JW857_02430 [Bacteroidales bacterium]|nr:hypothetical protein [Bacteroidales bacterium]
MNELFTFLDNPYLVILEQSLANLPGIERVDLLFYNAENAQTELHSIQRSTQNEQRFQLHFPSDSLDTLNAIRRKQSAKNWMGLSNIPYSNKSSKNLRQDLFSEFESHVLCLSFANTTDFSKDLFFFYFRKNASDFGLNLADNLLTTSNKAIIAHLIYNSVATQLKTIIHNQDSLRLINEQTRYILESKKNIEAQNAELKLRNRENLLQLTEFLINDLSANRQDVFYLSEKAKEQIGEFSGSVFELKKKLSMAISMAKTLSFGSGNQEYLLKADYFNFTNKQEKQAQETVSSLERLPVENRKHQHSKTYDFLNEMEQAAQSVLKSGWKLTSANVGHKMEKPITAAAISDKLKHHSEKIIKLLEQYPAKWTLIRKRFRPLQNVMVKSENKHFEQAS